MKRAIEILLVATIVGMPGAVAQENPPETQDTVLTFVHDLLQVLYPEFVIKGNRLKLCVSHPAESSWREISGVYFTVVPQSLSRGTDFARFLNGKPAPETKSASSDAILLDGFVWLPPSRRGSQIQQLAITGGIVTKKYEELIATVKLHPEWKNKELVRILSERGARFGPDQKQALLNSVPLKSLERFLGELRVTNAVFVLPDEDRVGDFGAGTLQWAISAVTHFQDGTDGHYAFNFEPFEGKLTGIWRLNMASD